MQLAEVIGTLVATEKVDGLAGVKFLIVQPLDRSQQPAGDPVVAADGVAMAGPGELVSIFIEFEKDTVLFYEMIAPFIERGETRAQLEAIIAEARTRGFPER